MTAFMAEVSEVLAGRRPPGPALPDSRRRPAAAGARCHVEARSLAEQLVCEANAVLGATGAPIALDDEVAGDALAFTLARNGRRARVETSFEGGLALSSVDGRPVELAGPDDVAALVLSLIAGTR